MTLYTAGQKIRASELNQLPQTYRLTSDTTINNSTSFVNVAGLVFSGAVNGIYLIEAMIQYRTQPTPGIKFRWQIPSGVTGWWGLQGGVGTSRVGDFDTSAFLDDFTSTFGASGDSGLNQMVAPKGVAVFGATAGSMQLQFTQITANATDTICRKNAIMRVTQLA